MNVNPGWVGRLGAFLQPAGRSPSDVAVAHRIGANCSHGPDGADVQKCTPSRPPQCGGCSSCHSPAPRQRAPAARERLLHGHRDADHPRPPAAVAHQPHDAERAELLLDVDPPRLEARQPQPEVDLREARARLDHVLDDGRRVGGRAGAGARSRSARGGVAGAQEPRPAVDRPVRLALEHREGLEPSRCRCGAARPVAGRHGRRRRMRRAVLEHLDDRPARAAHDAPGTYMERFDQIRLSGRTRPRRSWPRGGACAPSRSCRTPPRGPRARPRRWSSVCATRVRLAPPRRGQQRPPREPQRAHREAVALEPPAGGAPAQRARTAAAGMHERGAAHGPSRGDPGAGADGRAPTAAGGST